jgi:hypothetical protein
MEVTVQIDEALWRELEARARSKDVALSIVVSELLKQGMPKPPHQAAAKSTPFQIPTYAMGRPLVPLDKALALAAELDDEAAAMKLAQGK